MSGKKAICYDCRKKVPRVTISLCHICSKPVCRRCEVLLGDLLLCRECEKWETKDLGKKK